MKRQAPAFQVACRKVGIGPLRDEWQSAELVNQKRVEPARGLEVSNAGPEEETPVHNMVPRDRAEKRKCRFVAGGLPVGEQ